jgi:hypothetical protein
MNERLCGFEGGGCVTGEEGITEAENPTVLDVQVNVSISDLNAAKDLAGVDVRDTSGLVSIRIWADDISATRLGISILTQEFACDCVGVVVDIEGRKVSSGVG